MNISVTFRHMEASDAVRAYVEEKLEKLKKYIDEPIDAQVVIGVSKKIRNQTWMPFITIVIQHCLKSSSKCNKIR